MTTYRMRVLAVVEAASDALTGHEIAIDSCLSYKQTIDALNALYNYGRVQRYGHKFTARWGRVVPLESRRHPLELVFFRMRAIK